MQYASTYVNEDDIFYFLNIWYFQYRYACYENWVEDLLIDFYASQI